MHKYIQEKKIRLNVRDKCSRTLDHVNARWAGLKNGVGLVDLLTLDCLWWVEHSWKSPPKKISVHLITTQNHKQHMTPTWMSVERVMLRPPRASTRPTIAVPESSGPVRLSSLSTRTSLTLQDARSTGWAHQNVLDVIRISGNYGRQAFG